MNKNKVILSVLIILFTVSNTGLPLFVHLCNSMRKVSLETCQMCRVHKPTKELTLGRVCCESKSVITPITEKYISSRDNEKVQNITDSPAIVQNIVTYNPQVFTKNTSIFDSSPPGTISNSLYLNNSILLI